MRRILALSMLLSCAFAVNADQPGAAMKPVTSFGYLDTNKDAKLSPDEAKADWAVAQGFTQADANSDGYLDKDEFSSLSR